VMRSQVRQAAIALTQQGDYPSTNGIAALLGTTKSCERSRPEWPGTRCYTSLAGGPDWRDAQRTGGLQPTGSIVRQNGKTIVLVTTIPARIHQRAACIGMPVPRSRVSRRSPQSCAPVPP